MTGDNYGDYNDDGGYIAKLRGLPWSATVDDIMTFFEECKVLGGKNGIHMTSSREGRPSGEAFVEFETDDDLQIALTKDREHIGNRYIEVFRVERAEMEWMVKRSGPNAAINEDGCVRLRGLPFECSKEEIAQFFTGLEIVPNGITLLTDYSGRSSGEAYVQFVNREVAERALQRHREKIGHRYIEIFRSSLNEINGAVGGGYSNGSGGNQGGRRSGPGSFGSRPGPYDRSDRFGGGNTGRFQARGLRSFKDFNSYDRPANTGWNMTGTNNGSSGNQLGAIGPRVGSRSPYEMDSWGSTANAAPGSGRPGMHCVHMRGLPFRATQADVAEFFRPVVPVTIRLLQDDTGRASGEADVEFSSHEDAVRAMSKDKGHMQHRYIELFLNSAGGNQNGGGATAGVTAQPATAGFGAAAVPFTRRRV